MAISSLPSTRDNARRFISRHPAWRPGDELPWDSLFKDSSKPLASGFGAYGGHVYAQSSLAAARVIEDESRNIDKESSQEGVFGIHSIHASFTRPGLTDRPFIYEVTPVTSGRSFAVSMVNVRQPKQPSEEPSGPYPTTDADLPLNGVCLSCITTFKRSLPGQDDVQEPQSAQQRYADILSSRAPDQWDACPQLDLDAVKDMFPGAGPGAFPILDMRKVDMTAYNATRPYTEQRELHYYRLLKPLPKDDVNAHIACHAFEADRNGLLMLGNHVDYGRGLAKAASLSYSFYVHVNAEEAVMDDQKWWLQEICWPRLTAGRAMMESKLWSPEGKHIASAYQDGILLPSQRQATKL
ncbi:hypothetical protein HIM_03733 [Hirsutella minnesotensis 3608]|uniref:Acyl-CoA thioesterase-like N-terminal HotDog domain-containing protein n=1 Tax=Hirsutella minnesotensis 3608 TaxID=1043627 RepID=A0A0F7ZM12_9HYPO|nr:hypothetical protein HIM_03733 [Hirsutella minnesotensis 3608]